MTADTPAPQASAASPSEPTTLAGTRWRLTAIQSMDDAQGTSVPPAAQVYDVAFGADGRAAFTLNCNRANGGWTAEPSADGRSGGLAFSAVAMTRALCPPPSIDTRVARDMDYVRSYRIEGDRLSMSLMADGGIYVWTRDTGR